MTDHSHWRADHSISILIFITCSRIREQKLSYLHEKTQQQLKQLLPGPYLVLTWRRARMLHYLPGMPKAT